MNATFRDHFREDTSAMEEIGFIYVFALSVLLLSAVFYTIRDSTDTQQDAATRTYLEDQARLIAGIVQDVIDMHLVAPEIEYQRVVDLRSPDQIYRFRIVLTPDRVTLISRYKEITVHSPLYNPDGTPITPRVESDSSAILIRYDPVIGMISVSVVDPGLALIGPHPS